MDISALKQRVLHERGQWVQCDGYWLKIEQPTALQWYEVEEAAGVVKPGQQEAGGEGQDPEGEEVEEAADSGPVELHGERARRSFHAVVRFVLDWQGVTFGEIAPGAALSEEEASTEAPCDRELIELLIDERPFVGRDLFDAAQGLYLQRFQTPRGDQKKSRSGSSSPSGSSPSETKASSEEA